MAVYNFKLDKPYDLDRLKVKVNYKPLKKSAVIMVVLIAASAFILWAGDFFNVLQFGSETHSIRLTDILAVALTMTAVKGLSEAFIACKDKAREATRRNHADYVQDVLISAMNANPDFAHMHNYMLMNVTYTGECGWWERIGDTEEFMVYDATLSQNNLKVVTQKETKERSVITH